MSVNGITGAANTYDVYQASLTTNAAKTTEENTSDKTSEKKDDSGFQFVH